MNFTASLGSDREHNRKTVFERQEDRCPCYYIQRPPHNEQQKNPLALESWLLMRLRLEIRQMSLKGSSFAALLDHRASHASSEN